MPDVTLIPMTGQDLGAFIQAQVVDYTEERVLSGNWSRSDALEHARAGLARVIAWEQEAMDAERQQLLTAITPWGESVG